MEIFRAESVSYDQFLIGMNERIRPNELIYDELLILMMAIKRRKTENVAAMLYAEVKDVERTVNHIYKVEFDVYDSRGRSLANLEDSFLEDGFWRPSRRNRVIDDNHRVTTGYISDTDLGLTADSELPSLKQYSPTP